MISRCAAKLCACGTESDHEPLFDEAGEILPKLHVRDKLGTVASSHTQDDHADAKIENKYAHSNAEYDVPNVKLCCRSLRGNKKGI